jgi:GNAT superfamily N-acetyltransferase
MISIQEASLADAPAISRLLAQLGYPATLEEANRRISAYQLPGYKLLVAKENDYTAGFIALHQYQPLHREKPYGKIVAFCVDDRVRGTGIGSLLLTAAEDFFAKAGCVKIEVSSNRRRKETHDFYLHRGYEETSRYFVKMIG